MHVYIYIYIYILCISICMYMYAFIYMCVSIYVFVYIGLYVYMYAYMCWYMYVYLLVGMHMCESVFFVFVYICLFVCLLVSIYVSQHKCLWKVNEMNVFISFLGCYLSVWHCYLGSIPAFNNEIQISYNVWTKPLNQLRLIYGQFIYVLLPRFGCIFFFSHE